MVLALLKPLGSFESPGTIHAATQCQFQKKAESCPTPLWQLAITEWLQENKTADTAATL
jgi:hypothetical protein